MNTIPSAGIVYCDACNKPIRIVLKQEKLDDDKVGYFFDCNNCGEKYPTFAITKKGFELRQEMERMIEMHGDSVKKSSAYKDLLVRYQREVIGQYE